MTEKAERDTAAPLRLRVATPNDIGALAPLLVRLKRLNEEFDPMLKVREDVLDRARDVLKAEIPDPKALVLAAEGVGPDRGKTVGVVRARVRERVFYSPELEGVILDIYLLPVYRRRGVGEYLLAETVRRLQSMGAQIVTAEFPTQNQIASRFYAKRGFRPITGTHAKAL
jgi:ribosomal protein S18 acetylase RimI-like enzyme